jgi:DNA-binding MarR family transcriptional regulator
MHRGQAHLLSIISRKNGASQSELAEEMDVRPSSMTETLLKMEEAGLITRKQDENDQRIMRVFLAEAGEKAVQQSNIAALDLTTGLFNGLTSEEQVQMLSLIEKLSASLETVDRPGIFREHHREFHEKHHRHHGRGRPDSIPFYLKNRNPNDD